MTLGLKKRAHWWRPRGLEDKTSDGLVRTSKRQSLHTLGFPVAVEVKPRHGAQTQVSSIGSRASEALLLFRAGTRAAPATLSLPWSSHQFPGDTAPGNHTWSFPQVLPWPQAAVGTLCPRGSPVPGCCSRHPLEESWDVVLSPGHDLSVLLAAWRLQALRPGTSDVPPCSSPCILPELPRRSLLP